MAIGIVEFAPQIGDTSVSTSKSCTAGSAILVVAWYEYAGSVVTCTVGGVSPGSPVVTDTSAHDNRLMFAWLVENAAGGSTAVVCEDTSGGGSKIDLCVFEITGAATSSALDAASHRNGIGTAIEASAAGITISVGSIAVAVYAFDRTAAATTSGYTPLTASAFDGYMLDPRYQVFAGGASGEKAAGTCSPNAWYSAVIVAVKAAAAGGSTELPPLTMAPMTPGGWSTGRW